MTAIAILDLAGRIGLVLLGLVVLIVFIAAMALFAATIEGGRADDQQETIMLDEKARK